ncbi:LEAF RUST 10 DISEASE-RESISTANCE LOCUS RECEPTOR-LIKE PROTEIN KINASE-like 1.2 [Zingiber officinale]|uniref:LEAF RUST 10 DISEASE-RESISTANCE LOCUS RECEPTOR-LIKE PROTEIN KINASE-like 1.2 n=1 Tax=Zingiber officinale TaxID=94328 RepID=UPI001C4CE0BB|nr:LEAF RUST 10 DISEASE-RESISTANCE LOCUS RECEPTOR-LIKE PROTEIN KINASE-like 1.2 [Zingiber officinale]
MRNHRQSWTPYLVIFLCSVLLTFSPSLSDDGELFRSCGKRPFTCGERTVQVAYPFNTADRPNSCGHPSFELNCNTSGSSAITINVGRKTYVVTDDIDYSDHLITLLDQSFFDRPCPLPSENTDINTTLFSYTDRDVEVTFFFYCPSSIVAQLLHIECSSTLPLYFWPNSSWPQWALPCSSFRVRMDSTAVDRMMSNNISYAQALQEGFTVTWNESVQGNCGQCINSGGVCGYNNSRQVCFCSNNGSATESFCNPQGNSSGKTGVIIGAAAGVGGLAAVIFVGVCCYCRRRNRVPEETQQQQNAILLAQTTFSIEASPQIIEASPKKAPEIFRRVEEPLKIDSSKNKIFEYKELHEATNGFVSSNELGNGGFGIVYKGHLRDGRTVAIKRLYENSHRRMQQFRTEVAILSSLRHPNLVSLYGSTARDSRELLLVYEYVPNGTIADHLHGARATDRGLPWSTRMSIAIETADALSFLHTFNIVHRDVKTDNILLDGDFRVKVADFGLSRLFPPDATHVSTAPQGTPGYVDPEYHQCYRLTDKSDVYSFGVVLAELISSKPAVDVQRPRNDINLFNLAMSRIQKNELEELVDPRLWRQSNGEVIWMIRQVAEVAFRCLQEEREMRPTMSEVLDALRGIDDVSRNGAKWSAAKLDEIRPPGSPDNVIAAWESKKTTPNASA